MSSGGIYPRLRIFSTMRAALSMRACSAPCAFNASISSNCARLNDPLFFQSPYSTCQISVVRIFCGGLCRHVSKGADEVHKFIGSDGYLLGSLRIQCIYFLYLRSAKRAAFFNLKILCARILSLGFEMFLLGTYPRARMRSITSSALLVLVSPG